MNKKSPPALSEVDFSLQADFSCRLRRLIFNLVKDVMLNSVVFFRFFSVIPTVCRSDQIQFCYRRAFYLDFCKSPCSSAYLFTLLAVRGAVSWADYFTAYALRLANAFTSDCLRESSQFFTALIIHNLHAA